MHEALGTIFENKFAILSNFADSQDFPKQLSSHFMSFNAKKTNTF